MCPTIVEGCLENRCSQPILVQAPGAGTLKTGQIFTPSSVQFKPMISSRLTLLGDIGREPLLREKMAAGSGNERHCRIVYKRVKTGCAGAYNSHPFIVATAKWTRFELGWR
jgi:hypothetical protein